MKSLKKYLRNGLPVLIGLMLTGTGCGPKEPDVGTYLGEITKISGRYLWFGEGKVFALIGVYIPTMQEKNFNPAAYGQYLNMLAGKKVTVRLVEKKHHVGYPYVDLAEIFIDDVNINKYLLESGIAFFNEDHWKPDEKEEYRRLKEIAKSQGIGVWANLEHLEVLFIRDKKGRFIHFPECRHVRDLKPEERIDYYVPLPRSPFMSARFAYLCDTCRPKFKAMIAGMRGDAEAEKEEEHARKEEAARTRLEGV